MNSYVLMMWGAGSVINFRTTEPMTALVLGEMMKLDTMTYLIFHVSGLYRRGILVLMGWF